MNKDFKTFRDARIKLTSWYVLIIMFVSILFSLVIFSGVNREFNRFERFEQTKQERSEQGLRNPFISRNDTQLTQGEINDARERVILTLVLVNVAILIISGAAGYFLAGITLKPIKEMLDEQNRFVTDSSHELRTPLTSLRSEIEVNLRDKKLTLSQAKKLLESNLEDVIALQSLSDSLMELTLYQKFNGKFAPEKVSIKDVLRDSIKKISPLAKNKKIIIKENVKDQTFQGLRQSLTQLFVILLDNAIKYSDKAKAVTINSRKSDNSLILSIKDQGVGIDQEDLPHVFDRFYRANKSRSKSVMGYGLGLSIAKQIIDLHKGSINVFSTKGKGTEFIITLPISHA